MKNVEHPKRNLGYAVVIILALIILAVGSMFAIGNINNTVSNNDIQKTPNNITQRVEKHWGYHLKNTTPLIVVLSKAPHRFNSYNQESVDQIISTLKGHRARYGIKRIVAPTDNATDQRQLTSSDNKVQLLKLNVSNKQPLNKTIQSLNKAVKVPGMHGYITGNKVIDNEANNNVINALPKIELVSAIALFIVLSFMFDAWILPIITVGSIWISLELSRNIALLIDKSGLFNIANINNSYGLAITDLILLVIGAVTSVRYWIKFQHQIPKKHSNSIKASKNGFKYSFKGSFICSVFAFILCSFLDLNFAISIPLMCIFTIGMLYALGILTGKGAFWSKFDFKELNAKSEAHHPSITTIISMVILGVIIIVAGIGFHPRDVNYDTGNNVNNSNSAREGLNLAENHFSKGDIESTKIYIQSPHKLNNERSLKQIDSLTQQYRNDKGVKSVSSITQPIGQPINQLYVKDQLGLLTGKSVHSQARLAKVNPTLHGSDLGASQLRSIADSAQDIDEHLQKIQSIESTSKSTKDFSDLPDFNTSDFDKHNNGDKLSSSQKHLLIGTSKQLALIAKDTARVGDNSKLFGSQLSKLQSEIAQVNSGLIKLNSGFKKSNNYIATLQNSPAADVFYIPKSILKDKYNQPLKRFTSQNRKATLIEVNLKGNPASVTNQERTHELVQQAKYNVKGTSLDKSKITADGLSNDANYTRSINKQNLTKAMTIGLIIIIGLALLLDPRAFALSSIALLISGLFAYSASSMTNMISHTMMHKPLVWSNSYSAIIIIMIITLALSLKLISYMHKHNKVSTHDLESDVADKDQLQKNIYASCLAVMIGGLISGITLIIQLAISVIISLILIAIFTHHFVKTIVK